MFFMIAMHNNGGDLAQTVCIDEWIYKNYPNDVVVNVAWTSPQDKILKSICKRIRKQDYSSINALRKWVKEYEKLAKISSKYRKKNRFTKQEIDNAINYCCDHGENMKEMVKALGYPCRYTLQKC